MRGLTAPARASSGAALVIAAALCPADSEAAPRRGAPALRAGAASLDVDVPPGTPLGGYGGFPRRAVIPDFFGRFPYAFWFRPSVGVHDPMRVRGLVLEAGPTRVLWLTVDLVGVDPALVAMASARLRAAGLVYSAIVVAASHTHSGPGAYADSAIFAVIAVDRLAPLVRDRILDGLVEAARRAEMAATTARVAIGKGDVAGIVESRVQGPLDTELGVLKVTAIDGRPIGVVWNYAIHGTALGRDNLLLSGDVMADAGQRIERALGVPALFVNGAVGDVSPRPRGFSGVAAAGAALASGALTAWADARPESDPRLAVVHERVTLPSPALSLRNCVADWIPSNVLLGLAGALPASADIVAIAVGETAWVTIPGELETRLGLDIKAATRGRFGHVFIAGLSNDYLGYFVTPAAYRRPSYVACGSLYGERGGEIVRDAALAALRRLPARKEAPRAGEGSVGSAGGGPAMRARSTGAARRALAARAASGQASALSLRVRARSTGAARAGVGSARSLGQASAFSLRARLAFLRAAVFRCIRPLVTARSSTRMAS